MLKNAKLNAAVAFAVITTPRTSDFRDEFRNLKTIVINTSN